MRNEHTERTWHAANAGNDYQGIIADEKTGETIAVTYKKEYAPIIVTACNCFEELVEACERARQLIINANYAGLQNEGTLQALEHALARAKEV